MAADDEFVSRMAGHFRLFVTSDCDRYTPLYAVLGSGVADDPEILALLAHAPRREARPTLLFAAVHYLVLTHPDEPLAAFYPSVTGRPVPPGDPYPTFRDFCGTHRDELVRLIATRTTQTNETNRSVALRAVLGAGVADLADQPIALLEVGASAGLNLGFDRYCLPGHFGPPDSPVRLACDLVGDRLPPFGSPLPQVIWRAGLDQHPIAVDDPVEIRWLEACLWPEQVERMERFRAAVELARADPPALTAGDMVDDLAEMAGRAPHDAHLVIWHSWVLTYLARDRRPAFAETVAGLAGAGRSVTWLSAEAPGVVADVPVPDVPDDASEEQRFATLLGVQRFRGDAAAATHELVGRCHPHLRWMQWLA